MHCVAYNVSLGLQYLQCHLIPSCLMPADEVWHKMMNAAAGNAGIGHNEYRTVSARMSSCEGSERTKQNEAVRRSAHDLSTCFHCCPLPHPHCWVPWTHVGCRAHETQHHHLPCPAWLLPAHNLLHLSGYQQGLFGNALMMLEVQRGGDLAVQGRGEGSMALGFSSLG